MAAATQDCFIGTVSLAPFCTLERILQESSGTRSVLEEHFGSLQEKHFKAADALSMVRGLKKPVLLIHGIEDQTVPFEHGRPLFEQLGSAACFLPVEDGDHHLRNVDRKKIIAQIIEWMEEKIRREMRS